jgi:hypothetical protein
MATNEFPVYDAIAPSWADISVKASPYGGALVELADVAAVNTGCTVEVGLQRSPGGRIKKRTTGQVDYEASLTVYQGGYHPFMRSLGALAPTRNGQKILTLVHFDIQMLFTPPGSVEIYERHVRGCRLTSNALNPAEGTDANKIEIGLSCIQVVDIIDSVEYVLL